MSLMLEQNEQALQKCQVRHNGLLGTLQLTTKRVVFLPVDWTQAEVSHRISSITSTKLRRSHLFLRFFDAQPTQYEAAGPYDEPNLATVSERLSQLRRLQYSKGSSSKSKLEQQLAESNSALASYWRSSQRYQEQDAAGTASTHLIPVTQRAANTEAREGGHHHSDSGSTASAKQRTPSSSSTPAAQLAALLTSGQHLNPLVDGAAEGWHGTMPGSGDLAAPRTASFVSSTASNQDDDDDMLSWDALFEAGAEAGHTGRGLRPPKSIPHRHHEHRQHQHQHQHQHWRQRQSQPQAQAQAQAQQQQRGSWEGGRGGLPHAHRLQYTRMQMRGQESPEEKEELQEEEEHTSSRDNAFDESHRAYEGRAPSGSLRSRGGYSSDGSTGHSIATEEDALAAMANIEVTGPQSEEATASGIPVNARVLVRGRPGVLRYCGLVHFEAGEWAGIELDQAIGSHDGVISGVRYFRCPENHGVFVPAAKVERARVLTYTKHYALRNPMILPRPEWEEDPASCSFCGLEFTARHRRHHCRSCGATCCHACSPSKTYLPFLNYISKERVCEQCHPLAQIVWHAAGLMIRNDKVEVCRRKDQLELRRKAAAKLLRFCERDPAIVLDYLPALAAVINLCICPLDDLQGVGLRCLSIVAARPVCHGTLVSLGVFKALAKALQVNSDGRAFGHALKAAFAILSTSTQFGPEAIAAGVAAAVLDLMAECTGQHQRMCAWIIKALAKCSESRPFLLRDRIVLKRAFGASLRLQSHPAAQEAMLCAVAALSVPENAAHTLNQVHVSMACVLSAAIPGLMQTAKTGNPEDQVHRRRSLAHVACFLANICASEEDVSATTLARYRDDLLSLVECKFSIPELRLHATRGLCNLSRSKEHARPLLGAIATIGRPLLEVADQQLKDVIVKTFLNLALHGPTAAKEAMESFVEALFQMAQHDLSEALQERSRDALLLLGFDVTTEQRQYSASDVHPSQFTPFPSVAAPPSVFLGLSDDATAANQLSRSDMSAFDTYVPIKASKKSTRGAAIVTRLLSVLRDNQEQVQRYQDLLRRIDSPSPLPDDLLSLDGNEENREQGEDDTENKEDNKGGELSKAVLQRGGDADAEGSVSPNETADLRRAEGAARDGNAAGGRDDGIDGGGGDDDDDEHGAVGGVTAAGGGVNGPADVQDDSDSSSDGSQGKAGTEEVGEDAAANAVRVEEMKRARQREEDRQRMKELVSRFVRGVIEQQLANAQEHISSLDEQITQLQTTFEAPSS